MLKKLVIAYLIFLLIKPVYSAEIGLNNKFGIHLAQPDFEDLKKAAQLVNSSGGDWGYVTLVIQENDRNQQKWQEIFDWLREHHLIPLIRLATVPEGGKWRRPKKEEADDWVNFLDSLNWVVKNRYIILFNEPNHGAEWGGAVDAEDYRQVAFEFAKKLKERNSNFFIMLAGLDASAPHRPPAFEDEVLFLKKVLGEDSSLIDLIDGWASHSYPNPDFSGKPWDWGRGTIRTYQWELELLPNLGINKQLPVFITETGWNKQAKGFLSEKIVAEYFQIAYEQVWLPDERIWAVTPFILNYQSEPFLGFSWTLPSFLTAGEKVFYPQYYTVQSLAKIKGEPEQEEKGAINFQLPKELFAQSNYQLKLKLKNQGQAIWKKNNGYQLLVNNYQEKFFTVAFDDWQGVKPFEEKEINFNLKTEKKLGRTKAKFILKKNDQVVLESGDWQLDILPLPSLKFQINLWPKLTTNADDFEIQIFDESEKIIFKKRGIKVTAGKGWLTDIENIIFGKKYRLVILKPYYLPRQDFVIFKAQENKLKFKAMLPLDFNLDGRLSFTDFKTLVKNPKLLKLLMF